MKRRLLIYYFLFLIGFIVVNIPLIKAMLLPKTASISIIILTGILFCYYVYKQQSSKILITVFGCAILLNLFFVVGWLDTPWPTPSFQHREICLGFLSEGTLYGGQPYCAQGPIVYIFAKLIQILPGSDDMNFQTVSLLMLFLSFILLYIFKKKITDDNSLFFLGIFFVLYFIRIAEDDFTSVVAVFFLLLEIYFLYLSNTKHKEIYAGIFLGLCIFSKTHFFLASGMVALFYLIKERTKKLIISFIKITAPSLIFFVILKIIFPNFVTYYYTINGNFIVTQVLFKTLFSILTLRYVYNGLFFLFYIGFFISILRIINKKTVDLFSIMCSVVFLIMITLMLNTSGIKIVTETYRHFFVIMPFYVINLYLFKKEFPKFTKKLKIITCVILFIFIFVIYQILGGITFNDLADGSVFQEQKLIKKFQREISYPLFEIPSIEQGEKVLVFDDQISLFSSDGTNLFIYLNESDFENIKLNDPYAAVRPDFSFAPTLVKMGIATILDPNPNIDLNFTEINKKLHDLSYPIIVEIVPYRYEKEILYQNKDFIENTYTCSVIIGVLPVGYSRSNSNIITLHFVNQENCDDMASKIYRYYTQNFEYLCERGAYNEIIIKRVFEENWFPQLNKKCTTWNRTTDFIVSAHYKASYLAFFIILFLCWIVIKYFLIKDKNYSKSD
ncbi:hypothetical protein COV16_07295 [Candidatus Woesearchaeota archaeon CG10_big_fil_rev_8_21_14_0_10_34_8]|nr:MAG: hypothetical protein COV16_07295 [Candidatus Woesearchaeota archaeon CG10_big_fil_rev_8_21_14_0_10_34_8]